MAMAEVGERCHTHPDSGNALVLTTLTKGGALLDLDNAQPINAEPVRHRSCDSLGLSYTSKTVEVFVEVRFESHSTSNEGSRQTRPRC